MLQLTAVKLKQSPALDPTLSAASNVPNYWSEDSLKKLKSQIFACGILQVA